MKIFSSIKTEPVTQTLFPNGDRAYTYRGQLVVIPASTASAPPPVDPPPPPPPANFPQLINGGFESGIDGWQRYAMDSLSLNALLFEPRDLDAPGMDALAIHNDGLEYTGRKAIMVSGFNRCWRGGVFQTLVNVPIGRRVRIGAWAITYGSVHPGVSNVDVGMNSSIGIGFDAQGLTNPNAGRVDWNYIDGGDTVGNLGGGRDPKWQYIAHECVTTTSALTVFLQADLGKIGQGRANWPLPFTRGHFDDVVMEVLS